MAIPGILAMTAEEIRHTAPLPKYPAYFGCYFTDNGSILMPDRLSPGSGLILDDRSPIPNADHGYLYERINALNPVFLILDFQRPAYTAADKLIAVLADLPCPVVLPPQYAAKRRCPILLPPIPPHITAEEHLMPWLGREVWLELALDATKITVTAEGSAITAMTHAIAQPNPHKDSMLHCHYKITGQPDAVLFYCYRTLEDVQDLLHSPLPPNVTHTVAMYQEFGNEKIERQAKT